ncbi:MAG: glycosyltransferase [Gammaproteobacteria bacterium]|nr:glycosyltransferase [Gammaproteobacteria bacterium]
MTSPAEQRAAGAPAISLLVCTRDRETQLRRFLAALPVTEIRAAAAELVLVDNASADGSLALLESFAADSGLDVRVLAEPRPGKSLALNRGIDATRAPLVAFTDDDCYLGAGYLATALAEFASGSFQYAGGRIVLHDPSDSRIATNYSTRRRLLAPGSFLRAGLIQGANMVVSRAVFERIGGFDAALGPATRFRCEDIDLCARASAAGFTGAYLPSLLVHHHHGRKAGPGTEALKQANAHGRGAYYAKRIRAGDWNYLAGWIGRSLAPWRLRFVPQELRGAREYWQAAGDP